MKCNTLFLLVVFGLAGYVAGAGLYGVVTTLGGAGTQTVVVTVKIDPTSGNFTNVAECFIYIGASATYDGISAYDQKNNYLYYASDFDSAFVFGVDIAKGELLPPISIGSEAVTSISWDGTNNQLLLTGTFQDKSQAVFTFPYVGPSVELVNFTALGISAADVTYLNWKTGTFYFVFFNGSSYYIGSLQLSKPTAITSAPLGCGQMLSPDNLFFDNTNNAVFGIGYDSSAQAFKYFTVKNKSCVVTDLGLPGIVTAATYDPTANKLYLGYVDKTTQLVTVDTTTAKVIARVPTTMVIEDIQVSYAL